MYTINKIIRFKRKIAKLCDSCIIGAASITRCFINSVKNLLMHDGIEHAGYLAFLTMMAMIPFVALLTATIGLVSYKYFLLSDSNPLSSLLDTLTHTKVGPFLDGVMPRLREISAMPPKSFFTLTILSGVWSASSIFEGLRTILNRVYGVEHKPDYIRRRMVSIFEFFVMLFATTTFIFVFKILPYLLSWCYKLVHLITHDEELIEYINSSINSIKDTENIRTLATNVFIFFILLCLYHFVPNKRFKLYQHIPGAALGAVMIYIFTFAFSTYIKSFPQIHLIYGSIAGLIITLLFFYFCAIIVIFGAEFNFEFVLYKKSSCATRQVMLYRNNRK